MVCFLIVFQIQAAFSLNLYCELPDCKSCIRGYNYMNKSCLIHCPTGFNLSKKNCIQNDSSSLV